MSETQLERTNYTILNFIGDVGALFGTLQMIASFILLKVFQIGALLENSIIKRVFVALLRDFTKVKINLTFADWWISQTVFFCSYFRNTRAVH